MLAPGRRCLYTDALLPPAGMELDCGVATTYSLNMDTLLTIPLQLIFATAGNHKELITDGVALLSALREATGRISVFCQKGGIHVPSRDHILYPLLEGMIHQAEAPGGGAFHPKVWLLRFTSSQDNAVHHRLMISSRNITASRAWDVSLTLDGTPTGNVQDSNRQLAELIEALPEMTDSEVDQERASAIRSLAEEVRTTRWELPEGYRSVEFHLTGLNGRKWQSPGCRAITVVSPFLTGTALRKLYNTAPPEGRALLSTQESLDAIDPKVLQYFSRIVTLHDDAVTAEQDEDEDAEGFEETPSSLHAKIYAYSRYSTTHVVIGSANATNAALVDGVNVELMAELRGRTDRIGAPTDILEPEKGLGDLLVDYTPGEREAEQDEAQEAEDLLDTAQQQLTRTDLSLKCTRAGDAYSLELAAEQDPGLKALDTARAWPITLREHSSTDIKDLGPNTPVVFPSLSAASVTGLIAFDLKLQDSSRRFVLNLPLPNPPEDREGAIIRTVINNRQGFIRYLMLLLQLESGGIDSGHASGLFSWASLGLHCGEDGSGLLEQLLQALAESPQTLLGIDRLVRSIETDSAARDILPDGFLELWESFREVMPTDA